MKPDGSFKGVKKRSPLGGICIRIYSGQYYDSETGLHYNGFRDYNPATGRYLSPDPIGQWGGINLYGYTGNNPIMIIDPTGLISWKKVAGGTIEAIGGIAAIGATATADIGSGGLAIPATILGTIAGAGMLSHGVSTMITGFMDSKEDIPPVEPIPLATFLITGSEKAATIADFVATCGGGFHGLVNIDKLSNLDHIAMSADLVDSEFDLINENCEK